MYRFTLFISVFIAAILSSKPASAQDSLALFEVVRVNDHVIVFKTLGSGDDIVHGNATVLLGKNGSIWIDTFGDAYIAAKAIEAYRQLSDLPVRYIVNTHWHYDHIMGNHLIKKMFPHAEIITHNYTRTQIDTRVPRYIAENSIAETNKLIDTFTMNIQTGRIDDTTRLSDYLRGNRYPRTLALLKHFVKNYSLDFAYEPVSLSFSDSLVIQLDSLKVLLFHAGKANTPGDVMIHVPQMNLLITGDVLVSPIPYAFGSNQESWIGVLAEIVSMDLSIIVPGHGDIMYNKNYITRLQALFKSHYQLVKDKMQGGLSLKSILQNISMPGAEKEWAGDDEERKWTFKNYFLIPATKSVFQSLSGK